MGRLIFAAALLAMQSAAFACPLPELKERLQSADEHVTWFDFWQEMDPAESAAELGYATADLRDLRDRLKFPDCSDRQDAQLLLRTVERALATCVRWSKPREIPATIVRPAGPQLSQSVK